MFDEGTLFLVDVIQFKIFIFNITTRLTFLFNKNMFK